MTTKLKGLMWGADAPGEAIMTTIKNAVARFQERFNCRPAAVYVNQARSDQVEPLDGIEIRFKADIRKNAVWAVREDAGG